jgi:hypothetical protein
MGIASALRIPQSKLFGIGSTGFSSGEDDLENYNMMIESEVRRPMGPVIRKMLEINMFHLFGRKAPFQIKWPSLRVLSAEQEQNVKEAQFNRTMALYDRGLLDSKGVERAVVNHDLAPVDGPFAYNPEPPAGPENVNQFPGLAANSLTFSGHKLQGRDKFQGLDISIENKKGSYREGIDADGTPWKTQFQYPYGYIRGTVGVDKDHVDCYIGPNKEAKKAFIIHQNVPETGKYDEDKIMLGFNSAKEAEKAYKDHYKKNGFYGGMKVIPMDKLSSLLEKRKGKKL